MKKILLFIIILVPFVLLSSFSFAQDYDVYWEMTEIVYMNVTSGKETLKSDLIEKGLYLALNDYTSVGYLTVGDVKYTASVSFINEHAFLVIGNEVFPYYINSEGKLSLEINNDLTINFRKINKEPAAFSEAIPIENIIEKEEKEKSLENMIAEAEAAALAAIKPASVYDMHVSFSSEETKKMSLFMNYGRYYVSNNTMIGMAYDKSGFLPNLVKCEVIKDGDTLKQDVFTVLDRHVNANFLTAFDNQLYYIRVDRDSGMSSIARANLKAEEIKQVGSEMHEMAYLQIHDGRLWYTGDGHRLYSCLLNGKDNRVELDKTVYEPYFIAEDWLIYQDDEDGEALHIRCIKDGTDLKITAERSFNPVVDGTVLYFTSIPDNGGKAYLSRIDLSKPFKEGDLCFEIEKSDLAMSIPFYIADSTIYGDNNSLVSVEDWKKLTNSAWLAVEQRVFLVSERYNIYGEMYSEHATVTNLYLYDRISGEKSVFRHVY